jgi:hypothetical protein
MLSDNYGWLPSEIRKESMEDLAAYIDIIAAKKRIEKRKSKNGRK